jgi:hypothetical protein
VGTGLKRIRIRYSDGILGARSKYSSFVKAGHFLAMLGGPLVTTAWRIVGLRMEGRPPDTEGSCEYIE